MEDYSKSPAYQRALQRLRRLGPEQKAVFSSMALDESFADKEMRKKIQSMNLGTQKKAREANIELGKGRLALQEREIEFAKKQEPIATAISAAEAGVNIYTGYQQMKTSQEMARLLLSQKNPTPTQPEEPEEESYMRHYWRNP